MLDRGEDVEIFGERERELDNIVQLAHFSGGSRKQIGAALGVMVTM
jgi:hypothetical protein